MYEKKVKNKLLIRISEKKRMNEALRYARLRRYRMKKI